MSMAVLTAALLTTTFAVPALERAEMAVFAANHGGWIADVRHYLRNPLDYFAQRSPGARQSGQLIQSKNRMAQLGHKGEKPHEQVLPNIRYPSAIPDFIDDILPHVTPGPFDVPPLVVPPGPRPAPQVTPPPVVPVTNSPSTPGGTPGGAVPEPSTWFMLIWGMGIVGFGMRSQHRRRAKGAGFRVRI